MPPVIRLAEARDVEGAGAICGRVLSGKLPYQYELNIGLEGCMNLVAEEDGQVIGYATVLLRRWDPRGRNLWQRVAPYLAFIGVLPEKQGRGVGELLLRAVIRESALRCPNEPRLFLEHTPDNRAARLYARVGFRAMSRDEVLQLTGLDPKGPVQCFNLAAACPAESA